MCKNFLCTFSCGKIFANFVVVKKKKDVPPPRSAGTIQVTFSHRPFKTPSRESKAPEEEEWLAKMATAGRTTKTDNSDAVDMEEMNPLWLKDKGR